MAKKDFRDNKRWYYLFTVLAVLFLYVLIVNAWVVDDAYITFRTVDNFVNGYGLTWNIGERVQAYTHPLWMLVMSLFYLLTSECFYSVIVLSFVLACLSVFIVSNMVTRGFRSWLWKPSLLILAVLSSKALVDYASSGLENALSYLIASLFFAKFLTLDHGKERTRKELSVLFFLASLAFLNRPDTVLLYFPALVYLLYDSRAMGWSRLVSMVFIATLPASLWVLFSLVYYGYPFPNTAYAKMLSTEVPFSWKLRTGWEYLINSLKWDTASYFIVGIALWLSIRRRRVSTIVAMAGVLAYVVFVVFSAAAATHMSGRFFAVPFFISILVFIYVLNNNRLASIMAVALVVYIAWSPVSAVKFGTDAYKAYDQNYKYIDTKYFVQQEGAALINWESGKQLPDHAWYHYGEEFRKKPHKVHIGGALGGDAIGYIGFAVGPDKYILDRVALSCPLLSRLPTYIPPNINQLKSGHFRRVIPEGYVESLVNGRNMIVDNDLRTYYEVVRTITRDPIFSMDRFRKIFAMNLGQYDHLIENYVRRSGAAGVGSGRR